MKSERNLLGGNSRRRRGNSDSLGERLVSAGSRGNVLEVEFPDSRHGGSRPHHENGIDSVSRSDRPLPGISEVSQDLTDNPTEPSTNGTVSKVLSARTQSPASQPNSTDQEKQETSSSRSGGARGTRKRKAKGQSPTPDGYESCVLKAFIANSGREITVKVKLSDRPPTTAGSPQQYVGNDGNQYYCQVCREFGDVVCCDGCPRVYHHTCVPLNSISRKSLDNDDDPWYCPKCIGKARSFMGKRSSRKDKGDRRSAQQRCADCQDTRLDLDLVPCAACGSYVHSPSCIGGSLYEDPSTKPQVLFCQNCQAIDQEDFDNGSVDTDMEMDAVNGGRARRLDTAHDDEDTGLGSKKSLLRRKPSFSLVNSESAGLDKKRKKKKKKRNRSMSTGTAESTEPMAQEEPPPRDEIVPPPSTASVVQATPAFVFYLAENRWKIEKALSKKHRTFIRLPKGEERNALVAQEAVQWWTKLPQEEHTRFINMSMREFEARVIQWKEEKAYREMGLPQQEGEESSNQEFVAEMTADDHRLTYEKHDRLFLSTSVGSKPFALDPDQSYNRVLLDLLHDNRFHPLPMFCVNRPPGDTATDEHSSKVTIPYFEVHGPISTSIGDECLGCSRGWTHHCPVLQRRVPAVEHRAKLQPPLSSLLATRVGIGLRPRIDQLEEANGEAYPLGSVDQLKNAPVLAPRLSEEALERANLPVIPSCSVFDPSERGDDIVRFVEEVAAMKVPEPPRPMFPDNKNQKKPLRTLPTQKQREVVEDNNMVTLNKCGRCRTIVLNDTGCVQCRRAQLVINRSKKGPASSAKNEAGALKVQTSMLGRVPIKDGLNVNQSDSDVALSNAMLRERWCPSAILPPQKARIPEPSHYTAFEASGSDQNGMDDSEEVDEADSVHTHSESPSFSADTHQLEKTFLDEAPEQRVDDDGRPKKRLRQARALAMAFKETVQPDSGREKAMRHHRKEASELHKKTVNIACYGILLAMLRRDPLHLFAQPVSAEGYSSVVRNPIDFGKIRDNVLAEKYGSLGAFVADARRLCDNALVYNPQASIYYKIAKDLRGVLAEMHKRASSWIGIIKDAHSSYLQRREGSLNRSSSAGGTEAPRSEESADDPFAELRKKWPEGVQMLENGEAMREVIASDFMRTKENEIAFYGCLAVRRAAVAAESSLAPYTDSCGLHSVIPKRKHYEDEDLREHVDKKVSEIGLPQLQNVSTWREESVVRLVRKVQKLRLERRIVSENGCTRCDGIFLDTEAKIALSSDFSNPVRPRKKGDDVPRVHSSRLISATGLGSAKTCQKIVNRGKEEDGSGFDSVGDSCVSVRGSKIHGMGLFADQPFSKGDVVAEYLGEYVVNPVADEREKAYGEQRIQDYQFRLDDKLVIDATKKGGPGRYINHNCSPNCSAKIIRGKPPNEHLRRVMIVAQRTISVNEEISYDYQFPLELDLSARIPCNCQSDACRGFMNWDLPEKGSNNRALLVQKRGANMRDRIRRLGRPLKKDEMDMDNPVDETNSTTEDGATTAKSSKPPTASLPKPGKVGRSHSLPRSSSLSLPKSSSLSQLRDGSSKRNAEV